MRFTQVLGLSSPASTRAFLFDSGGGGQIQCISGLDTVRAMLFERALRARAVFELILPSLFTV